MFEGASTCFTCLNMFCLMVFYFALRVSRHVLSWFKVFGQCRMVFLKCYKGGERCFLVCLRVVYDVTMIKNVFMYGIKVIRM